MAVYTQIFDEKELSEYNQQDIQVSKDYQSGKNVYILESYKGCVVSLREYNGYDDSDFFATVYDQVTNTFKEIQYATTRGWCYNNGAVKDATPEIEQKYKEYQEIKRQEYLKKLAEQEALEVTKGKKLQVIKGRKIPHGTIGICFWAGETRFGRSVGLQLANGEKVFTAEKNVEIYKEVV
jgi:hypothetical protein